MADQPSAGVNVWSLARSGRNGGLALGQTRIEVEAAFGRPTSVSNHISRYDSIELHFADDVLWLVHCEFGGGPLPRAVWSAALGIEPGGLAWPLDAASLISMVASEGFELEIVEQSWACEYRFGWAVVHIHQDDELVSWSIRSSENSPGAF